MTEFIREAWLRKVNRPQQDAPPALSPPEEEAPPPGGFGGGLQGAERPDGESLSDEVRRRVFGGG